jgi:hypothetical protein
LPLGATLALAAVAKQQDTSAGLYSCWGIALLYQAVKVLTLRVI